MTYKTILFVLTFRKPWYSNRIGGTEIVPQTFVKLFSELCRGSEMGEIRVQYITNQINIRAAGITQ